MFVFKIHLCVYLKNLTLLFLQKHAKQKNIIANLAHTLEVQKAQYKRNDLERETVV